MSWQLFYDSLFLSLVIGTWIILIVSEIQRRKFWRGVERTFEEFEQVTRRHVKVIAWLALKINPQGHVDIPIAELEAGDWGDMKILGDEENVRILVK